MVDLDYLRTIAGILGREDRAEASKEVGDAADEIERLREERARPLPAEMRLAMYRGAALTGLVGRPDGWASWERCAREVETIAHAMLAAERPASSPLDRATIAGALRAAIEHDEPLAACRRLLEMIETEPTGIR